MGSLKQKGSRPAALYDLRISGQHSWKIIPYIVSPSGRDSHPGKNVPFAALSMFSGFFVESSTEVAS